MWGRAAPEGVALFLLHFLKSQFGSQKNNPACTLFSISFIEKLNL